MKNIFSFSLIAALFSVFATVSAADVKKDVLPTTTEDVAPEKLMGGPGEKEEGTEEGEDADEEEAPATPAPAADKSCKSCRK